MRQKKDSQVAKSEASKPDPVAAALSGSAGAPAAQHEVAEPAIKPADLQDAVPLRGASVRTVENMEASLSIPTATSYRAIPVKLLEENRLIINEHQSSSGGAKVSFTHLIAWAVVQALQRFPALNSFFKTIDGAGHRVLMRSINLGVAVDVERKDGARSLLVPIIKNAERLTFRQFLGTYDELVSRVRKGTVNP